LAGTQHELKELHGSNVRVLVARIKMRVPEHHLAEAHPDHGTVAIGGQVDLVARALGVDSEAAPGAVVGQHAFDHGQHFLGDQRRPVVVTVDGDAELDADGEVALNIREGVPLLLGTGDDADRIALALIRVGQGPELDGRELERPVRQVDRPEVGLDGLEDTLPTLFICCLS
jgi:hypothetical protein